MAQSQRPTVRVVAPEGGSRLNVLGADVLMKTDGDQRFLTLADHPVPPGYGVPMHMHDAEDESFFVLEGEVTFESDDGVAHVRAGGFVHCPRGSRHSFRNETNEPARMLVIGSAGGGLDAMMRGFDRTARETGSALAPEMIGVIAAQNGIRIL